MSDNKNNDTIYIPNPSPKLIQFIKERLEIKRNKMEELRQKYLRLLNR